MFPSSIPYGSQNLSVQHDQVFDMPWVKQLSAQYQEFNLEHHAVLHKLNDLLHALNIGDRHRIAMACTSMSAAARAHFANEEELMLSANYPDRTAHMEQHEELLRRLARIRFRLISGVGHWSPVSEWTILEQWFVPHLTYADHRFAKFIVDRQETAQAG